MCNAKGDEQKVMMDANKPLDVSEVSLNSATSGVGVQACRCAGECAGVWACASGHMRGHAGMQCVQVE